MAWTEQDLIEIKEELLKGSQGVGDVPDAEQLEGISSLPAYQEVGGQNMPKIVRAPLELLAAPAIEAAGLANEAATSANEKAQVAQDAAQSANTAAGNVNTAVDNATVATNAANAATAAANQAAIEANKSAENAEGKAQAAQVAADNANDTAEHPTYIGQDHYVYKWNKTTSSYDKTDIYTKGDAFSIKKVYASVAELEADTNNTGIAEGDFVLVNTGDVENPDNAKLYVKAKSDAGVYSYEFLVDMSGAIGFTGKTPQFSMGTISTLEAGSSATATVSEDGVDSDGNPKYKINFAIPRGNPGAPFNPVGQYDTLELLQAAIPDGSGVNGMIAVGTKAPYEYYAWLNGGWVNQGKVAGGGSGNIVAIPFDVIYLSNQSSSAEIFNAFGSKDNFMDICKKLYNNDDAVCVLSMVDNYSKTTQIVSMCSSEYTDEDNASIQIDISSTTALLMLKVNVGGGNATAMSRIDELLTDATSDGNAYGRKDGNWVEVPEKSDVLTKTNATEYTPTGDYQPATKKYVDNMNYGKVINGSAEILNNCNLTGAEAEAKIATLFGSVDDFRQCVVDIFDNHTKYYYVWNNNNFDVGGIAWVSTDRNNCELHFTFNYPNITDFFNIRVVLRYAIGSTPPSAAIIQNISTDDKLKTMFADITENPEQNLDDIRKSGIMNNPQNAFATYGRNYPILEAGTLFYGTTAYGRANQIYGGFSSNRWFARGGGDNNYTAWREFAFKDDIYKSAVSSGSIDNITTAGEYVIYPDVTDGPFTDYCWLKVMGGSDIVQIVIRYSTLEIAIRSKINGNWRSWKLITPVDI